MRNLGYIVAVILIILAAPASAAVVSFATHLGYSPSVGGSMASGWQAENLQVYDGINDINRSGGGFAVSTVEQPAGLVVGADYRVIANTVYWKTSVEYVYQISGGTGKTIDQAATELVEVKYSQWSLDVPVTVGITYLFWGETRFYCGIGAAFAYGTYTSKFKSASTTYDHSASFTGYAIPLVAEFGGEYRANDNVSFGCEVKYIRGSTAQIKSGTDYARVDFTGFHITALVSFNFNI